jgi:hypothetical protein
MPAGMRATTAMQHKPPERSRMRLPPTLLANAEQLK